MLVDLRSLHLHLCLIGALLAKDQFSYPRSMLQQYVLHSGPFLKSPSLGFFSSNRQIRAKCPSSPPASRGCMTEHKWPVRIAWIHLLVATLRMTTCNRFPQLTFAIGVKRGSFVIRDWNNRIETTQHNSRYPVSLTATCSDLVWSISPCICKDRLSPFPRLHSLFWLSSHGVGAN
jgi:hypothetical protein